MKLLPSLSVAGLLILLSGCEQPSPAPQPIPRSDKEEPRFANRPAMEVQGRTQCTPGRKGVIAPVPLHPVIEVRVAPGDRVKKNQVLVRLDDDEPRADVRARKASLETAQITLKEARRHLAAAEKAYSTGAMPEASYHTARTGALKVEQEERVAKAALEAAEAELEHYTITAPIDGVVAWLDVHLGTVSRPGTTVWGEILDLSEIDVRCELPPEQLDRVAVGQAAEVRANAKKVASTVGKVVFVGISADQASGLVPVIVRVPNSKATLRCGIAVQVRFTEAPAIGAAR
jgi:RND family efflux transporter MFP subunit